MSRIASGIALALLLVHCIPSPPSGDFPGRDAALSDHGDAGQVEIVDILAGPPKVEDMSGTWCAVWEAHTCIELGRTTENVSLTYYLVKLEQEGLRLRETRTTCLIDIGPVLNLKTIIPDALLEGAGPSMLLSTLNSLEAGAEYVSGEAISLWGVDLEDPVADRLPESEQDPAVVDTDGDGRPGATLHVGPEVCEMGVAQRIITRFWGQLVSAFAIVGTGAESSEQNVLWATSPFCRSPFETRPARGHNRFLMVRVDGEYGSLDLDVDGDDRVSCEEILLHRDLIFQRSEPDDSRCIAGAD